MNAQRQSPNIASDISLSIRSHIMLPARSLMKRPSVRCDSLIYGPFCALTNNITKLATDGFIDYRLWGDISADAYYNMYMSLSDYASDHWDGLPVRSDRSTLVSDLVRGAGSFVFEPHPLAVDVVSFLPSLGDGSLYTLNSFYGFISFVFAPVSLAEFVVRAPINSHVLVRAYCDGLPVFFRLVRSGTVMDVSLSSQREDPSIESLDLIEIIGFGAEILTLSVSHIVHNSVHSDTFVFFTRNEADVSVRAFPPSAYLVDMQTIVEQDLTWKPEQVHVASALDELEFTEKMFLERLAREEANVPLMYLDHFILSLERDTVENRANIFTETFLESSPQLLSYFLGMPTAPHGSNEVASRIARLQGTPEGSLSNLREQLIETFQLDMSDKTPEPVQLDLLLTALKTLLTNVEDLEQLAAVLVAK